jgi:predicted NBD/HSP70 family sugar kinase
MIIVFDIGGTNMRVAGVEDGVLGAVTKVPTPKDPEEGMATLVRVAKGIAGKKVIDAAAGDIAGSVAADGTIFDASNLPRWEGRNLARELSEKFGAPVHIANDCVVVGLGELKYGAGKGFSDVVYLTVSTGVGGAHVLEHDIMRSPVLVDDFEALKQKLGEQISGTAVKEKFGIEPKDLDSLDERNKLADILAQGLSEIVAVWPCEAVILGGSMITGVNPIPLERAVATLATLTPNPPVIKMAELGDAGGLHGGIILAGSH